MTSRQVECGKIKKGPSHHTHAGTRGTQLSVLHVVSVPQYGRRSMISVAIFAPSRPSLRMPTLRDNQLNVNLYTYRSQRIWQFHQCSVCWNSTSIFALLFPHPVAVLHTLEIRQPHGVLKTEHHMTVMRNSRKDLFSHARKGLDRLGDIESGCALVAHHKLDEV